jgi:hypothetical protein
MNGIITLAIDQAGKRFPPFLVFFFFFFAHAFHSLTTSSGHGSNTGFLGGTSLAEDGVAAIRYLQSLPDVNASNIAAVGWSMGGGTVRAVNDRLPGVLRASVWLGSSYSMNGNASANVTAPRNVLFALGRNDELIDRRSILRDMRTLVPASEVPAENALTPDTLYGNLTEGTARKLCLGPSDHVFEPLDDVLIECMTRWILDSVNVAPPANADGTVPAGWQKAPIYSTSPAGGRELLGVLAGLCFWSMVFVTFVAYASKNIPTIHSEAHQDDSVSKYSFLTSESNGFEANGSSQQQGPASSENLPMANINSTIYTISANFDGTSSGDDGRVMEKKSSLCSAPAVYRGLLSWSHGLLLLVLFAIAQPIDRPFNVPVAFFMTIALWLIFVIVVFPFLGYLQLRLLPTGRFTVRDAWSMPWRGVSWFGFARAVGIPLAFLFIAQLFLSNLPWAYSYSSPLLKSLTGAVSAGGIGLVRRWIVFMVLWALASVAFSYELFSAHLAGLPHHELRGHRLDGTQFGWYAWFRVMVYRQWAFTLTLLVLVVAVAGAQARIFGSFSFVVLFLYPLVGVFFIVSTFSYFAMRVYR